MTEHTTTPAPSEPVVAPVQPSVRPPALGPQFDYCTVYHCAGDCGQPHNQQELAAYVAHALPTVWPREAEDRVNQLLGQVTAKELECQRLREALRDMATMLEDCAHRLEFVSGGGDHTVSHKCLKAAAAVLRPNAKLTGDQRP